MILDENVFLMMVISMMTMMISDDDDFDYMCLCAFKGGSNIIKFIICVY